MKKRTPEWPDDDGFNGPSKSQRKRDHHALIELGRQLTALSDRERRQLDLPETIHAAVLAATRMRPSGARERHFRYLGNLLQKTDHEALQHQLAGLQQPSREQTARLHRAEAWRERILREGEPAIDALLIEVPVFERSRLLRLLAEARLEAGRQHPPKSARLLFRYLRDTLPAADTPVTD